MNGINRATILGNLGDKPELRYLPNGTAVTVFSVATSKTWKDKETGKEKTKTEWHRIEAFSKKAEILCQYLEKGSPLYLEGHLVTDKYEKDGVTHYSTKIRLEDWRFLGGKKDEKAPLNNPPNIEQSDYPTDEEVPF